MYLNNLSYQMYIPHFTESQDFVDKHSIGL